MEPLLKPLTQKPECGVKRVMLDDFEQLVVVIGTSYYAYYAREWKSPGGSLAHKLATHPRPSTSKMNPQMAYHTMLHLHP